MYDVYVTGSTVVDPQGEMFPVTRGDIIRYNQLCGKHLIVLISKYKKVVIPALDFVKFR